MLLLFFCILLLGAKAAPTPTACPQCVQVRVGPPHVLYGPASSPLDNPFISIEVQGTLLGYSANSNTELLCKGSLNNTLPPSSAPVVLTRGEHNNFDECGAWLNAAVVSTGSTVIGWYHAECWCNYSNNGQTHKSIAYAISTDGGLTFQKTNYPNNQIITGSNISTNGRQSGNGDHAMVVGDDGYYYCYFYDWDAYHPAVARSLISTGGVPGTWYKYYNGDWLEPGLGGKTSSIANLQSHTVVMHETGELVGVYGVGVSMNFGASSLQWSPVTIPVLFAQSDSWTRNSQSQELIAYATFLPFSGTGPLENQFWLYYTYLLPGQGFNERYLVRRLVTLNISNTEVIPQSATALEQYVNGGDYWTTTAFVPANYSHHASLGYIFPQSAANTIPIYDCYITAWDDHMLGLEKECTEQGVVMIRQLGWVYTIPPSPSPVQFAPIYRCFNSSDNHHYVSLHQDCDNLGKLEFTIGYVAVE